MKDGLGVLAYGLLALGTAMHATSPNLPSNGPPADAFAVRAGKAWLMVVCDRDLELVQTSGENHALQDQARAFFNGIEGGALAMVGLNDLMFAVCRQFQMLATSSRARLEVFDSIPEAEEWLRQVRADGRS